MKRTGEDTEDSEGAWRRTALTQERMKTLVAFLFLGSLRLAWCGPRDFNIARIGEASQSSDYQGATPIGYALRAIDSVNDTDWNNGFCSHTNKDQPTWWRLDMKNVYKVNIVVLTGRSDGGMERMMGAELRIGNSPDNNNPVCGTVTQISDPTTTFYCNEMEGRYVSVVIPERSEYLSICEMEVYGAPCSHMLYY